MSRSSAYQSKGATIPVFAEPAHLAGLSPFELLRERLGRPLKVAILSDFVRIPYANGAVFQTRFLYQELRRCGHEVTVIGPHDPDATPEELAPGTVSLPSMPIKAYPGVHLPLPLAPWVFDADRWDFDICFAQTTSLLAEFGVWLRKMKGIPLLCVNTTHLTAAYEVLVPDRLARFSAVHRALRTLTRPYERLYSGIYNESDGLVVLSEGLRTYWRDRGVTVPIHVIGRAVSPEFFDKPLGADPYAASLGDEDGAERSRSHGPRLLCAGRHTREKSQDRLIRIFAEYILPQEPSSTLTLVGQGPDTEAYKRLARDLGVERSVLFTGEVSFGKMQDYYAYADVFVHASQSETYGNVLGEALWCGTPTVAFNDGMGVSSQVKDGVNGLLIAPGKRGPSEAVADAAFGRAVVELVRNPELRARLGSTAAKSARERSAPRAVLQKMADAFEDARRHLIASGVVPATLGSRADRWRATLKHFQPWTTFNGAVCLAGYLRPAERDLATSEIQPQFTR